MSRELRAKLHARPLDERLADTCPGCGRHMLDVQARLDFIYLGGTITCPRCGTQKTRPQEQSTSP